MNVGLPGTGIGGAYYMLLVLFMPVRAARQVLRCGRPARWVLVARQSALALLRTFARRPAPRAPCPALR